MTEGTMSDSTTAWLADGSMVRVPERQYLPLDGSDRHYRTEPLRGSAHTLAVFFNPSPSSDTERWVCVGWTVAT